MRGPLTAVAALVALVLAPFSASADAPRDVAPALLMVMSLRADGHDLREALPEQVAITIGDVDAGHFLRVKPAPERLWRQVLAEAYAQSPVTPEQALPLLLCANQKRFPRPVKLTDPVGPGAEVLLPSPSVVGEPGVFITDLAELTARSFDAAVVGSSFDELERLYLLLHDVLRPLVEARQPEERISPRNPTKQLVFDYRLAVALRAVSDHLAALFGPRSDDWELAWKAHDGILAVQQQMMAVLDDPHIVVKDPLAARLESFTARFRGFLERELQGRRRRLTAALSRSDVETARSAIQGILYQLKPAIGGILAAQSEETLYRELCLGHQRYVAPTTRERSLAFSNHFGRLAALLAPPENADNYRLGFKISDVEFQVLRASSGLVFHTDCSGFIGRIYRELAKIAGLDMRKFAVADSGVIGSVNMIEPKTSTKLALAAGPNPFKTLLQGDYFYYERQGDEGAGRHVIFFDRLIEEGTGAPAVSIWEASPGGVKHRVKPISWITGKLNNGCGKGRNGAYRLNEMDAIDQLLERRGFLF